VGQALRLFMQRLFQQAPRAGDFTVDLEKNNMFK